jgi:ketosteroid isomerase-like protein
MSENLELVRSICAAWERGDYSSVEWADPEIEFAVADGLNPDSWTGLTGLAQGFRNFLSAWEGLRSETDEFREIDKERVLVLTHLSGRGKTSGVELGQVQAKQANLLQVRDGRVIRLVIYNHRDRALSDLGLAE